MGELLALLQIADMALTVLSNANIDLAAFTAARDKARAEGRQLTVDELRGFAATAQTAIDAIPGPPVDLT